ncbi:unnamed protein product [Heterobilharzia americana]|nr:unnamed protein product [Heterobilharzia americana]
MRTENNKKIGSFHCKIDNTNINTVNTDNEYINNHSNIVDHLSTNSFLNECSHLIKNTNYKDSTSLTRKRLKVDKDCSSHNNKSTNTSVSSTAISSSTKSSTNDGSANDVIPKDNDNKNGTKSSTVSTAAYKYLTWREKDRRRRFREEWKHLWLVIPHGLYEVMCLVCHKVMTQRKLDTIKRHTVRRHAELLKMPESDRQELFDQLLKQHNTLGNTNTNVLSDEHNKLIQTSGDLCKSSPQKNSRSSSNIQQSNTITHGRLHQTPDCLTNQASEANSEGSPNRLNSIPSKYTPISQRTPRKGSLCGKSNHIVNTNIEHIRNFSPSEGNCLPKLPLEDMLTGILNAMPLNLRLEWYDHLKLLGNAPPLTKLQPSRLSNCCRHPEYPTSSSFFRTPGFGMSQCSGAASKSSTIMPPKSPISTKMSNSDCSFFCPHPSTIPNISQLENFAHSLKSFHRLYEASGLIPPPLSLFMQPEKYPSVHNPENLTSYEKQTSDFCFNNRNTNTGKNSNFLDNLIMNHADQDDCIINGRSNFKNVSTANAYSSYQFNQTLKSSLHNCQNTRSSQHSDTVMNVSDYLANHMSAYQTSTFSSNPGITESQAFMMSPWFTSLLNSAKTSNQSVCNSISSNLHKPIWDIPPCTENSTLVVNFPNSDCFNSSSLNSFAVNQQSPSNFKPKSEFITPSFNQEVSPCQVNLDIKPKLNTDLNKFTISSLLNKEYHPTGKSILTPTEESDDLQPDNSNKQKNILSDTNLSSRLNDLDKIYSLKSIPEYISCLFCGVNEKKMELAPDILNQLHEYGLQANILSNILTKPINLVKRKCSAFTDFTEISNSLFKCKELDTEVNLFGADQVNSETLHKGIQIPVMDLNSKLSQDVNDLETYMQIYYTEVLKHHCDNIQIKRHLSQHTASECLLTSEGGKFCPKITTDM